MALGETGMLATFPILYPCSDCTVASHSGQHQSAQSTSPVADTIIYRLSLYLALASHMAGLSPDFSTLIQLPADGLEKQQRMAHV